MKKWKLLFYCAIFACVFAVKSVVVADESSKDIFFNELFWSGSNISSSDEFIELKNNTTENIDLAGWQITGINSSGEEFLMLTIPSGIIPAGGFFLIANSDKDYHYSKGEAVINIKPDIIDSAITLNNDKLQIKLYDGAWNNGGGPIDVAGDGNSPLAGDNNAKISMERILPPKDGRKLESWQNASHAKNLDPGSVEIANPETSGKPEIVTFDADQSKIYLDGNSHTINFKAVVNDPEGIDDIKSVELNLEELGGEKKQMNFEGGVYSFTAVIDLSANAGKKKATLTLVDSKGLCVTAEILIEIYELSDNVKINEIFPKPENGAENEFIELYNNGKKDVNLFGWQLDDVANGGSSPYLISDNFFISADGFLTFYKKDTKIGLNDSGDTIRLINPLGEEIDLTPNYGTAKENCSYNKTVDGWAWSNTKTPNSINIITKPSGSLKSSDSYDYMTIKQAKEQSNGTQITVEGVVNSLPEYFSALYFYIQDEKSGIQIYCHDKDFPNLSLGDKIKVYGKISSTTNGTRLKIDNKDNIEILERDKIIVPLALKTGEINKWFEGMLIKTCGKVVESSGSTFYIDDGTGVLRIYIVKSTGIKKPETKKGTFVEITGILILYKNSWRLEPRFQSDLYVEASAKKEIKSKMSLIKKAYAKENFDETQDINLTNYNKAKEIDFSEISKQSLLIKSLEIAIIISMILLIILIGDGYARKDKK